MKFNLVTVAFEKENPILEIQARSIAKYVDLQIDRIIVIDNSNNQNLSIDKTWYGKYQHLVELHTMHGLVNEKELGQIVGYYRQQLLKLASYQKCNGDVIIILDTKNWFIKPITEEDLIKDNLILGDCGEIDPAWNRHWDFAFECFGLDFKEHKPQSIFYNTTPFLIKRETLKEIYNYNYNMPIRYIFRFRQSAEFCLIIAYIIKHFDSWNNYFFREEHQTGIWISTLKREYNLDILIKLGYTNHKIFSTGIHRNIWKKLTKQEKNLILNQWNQDNIIDYQKGKSIIDQMIALNP